MTEKSDNGTDEVRPVHVYGLRSRDRVRRLIQRLVSIPCVPSDIHRIDKFGRILCVNDTKYKRYVYVRVVQWRDNEKLPIVEWSTNAAVIKPGLGKAAAKVAIDNLYGVRQKPPMVVNLRLSSGDTAGAKKPDPAS